VRKNNKQFVRTVVILAVVGFIALMIAMFVVLQSYLSDHGTKSTYVQVQEEVVTEPVVLSETLNILIEEITESHIMGYDIHNQKMLSKVINEEVKVSDAYGNVLPINQLMIGDIVEINYQEERDRIVSISKSSHVQSWKKISGITVDEETKHIDISGQTYEYADEVLVVDGDGIPSTITKVGPFDIVSVQAMDNVVWSIIIHKASASLNLLELPTQNGQIEIDNSRLIMFKDVTEPIKLVAGKHRIVIKMKGYETIVVEDIQLEANEVYDISLKEAERVYKIIQPRLLIPNLNYTVTIGDKVYQSGEEIRLPQDEYKLKIDAEGFESFTREVNLFNIEKDICIIDVALVPIEEEEKSDEISESESSNSSNTAIGNSKTITINTEPTGANVYINGELKGVTPYIATLNNGSYGILLEKTNYEVYSTNILLDGSNDQSTYLYKLTPRG